LDSSLLSYSANQIHHIPLATYCLPYIRLPKMPNQHIHPEVATATAMFVKTLDSCQHSMWLIPESQSFTLISNRKNLRTRYFPI
jgi:hypothetical protein